TQSVSGRRLFPVVVIGYMANDVLPVRMGELVRAYVLGLREGISKATGLSTIFVERVFDGLAMIAFLAGVAAFIPLAASLKQIAVATAVLFLALSAGILVLAMQSSRAERLVGYVVRLLPAGARGPVQKIASSMLVGLGVMRSGRAVVAALVLSIAAWLCEAGMYYLIALGFFPEIPFYVMLLTVAVANLGTMIPSSPGYVGTFDALAVFTLGLFGIGNEVAVGYTAVLHAALIFPITFLGFFFLWRENLTLGGLRRAPISAPASVDGLGQGGV
ncbi:MAG: lysylphosphatidylglycerol synthase transmembrane domain-containing protein, partial [Chloroflexota bacterium]